ncbi:response regulator [Micromonospora sp. LZ34]
MVLLIEDDAGDALLTREMLIDSGISSRFAQASSLAEASVSPATPDCVLLDLHLPDCRGLEALRRVLHRWPDAAVVVLTGLDDAAMGTAAVAAGAQDYLVKGHIDGALLGRTIEYAIQRRRAVMTELRDSRMQASENIRLQRGLLPTPLTTDPTLTVVSEYVPGRGRSLLGGDFFDLVQDEDYTRRAARQRVAVVLAAHRDDVLRPGLRAGAASAVVALRRADEDVVVEDDVIQRRRGRGCNSWSDRYPSCCFGRRPGRCPSG